MYDVTHLRHPRRAPIPAQDETAFYAERRWEFGGITMAIASIVALGILEAFLLWWGMGVTSRNDTSPLQWALWILQWAFWAAVLVLLLWAIVRYFVIGDPSRGLFAFARENGLVYEGMGPHEALERPGILLETAKDARFLVWLRGSGPFDGTARIVWRGAGADARQPAHSWCWAGWTLSVAMPHILLMRRDRSDGVGELPVRFSKVKELKLGGIFDDRWRTLVPESYEQDVFQILTPDILEPLAREDLACDIEIVDRYVNVLNRDQAPTSPFWWETLGALEEPLRRLAAKRWTDRSGQVEWGRIEVDADPSVEPVAPGGRRLPFRWAARRRGTVLLLLTLAGAVLALTYLLS